METEQGDLGPLLGSCAHPSRNVSGTPSKPSNSRRLTSGVSLIACRVNSPSMSSGARTAASKALPCDTPDVRSSVMELNRVRSAPRTASKPWRGRPEPCGRELNEDMVVIVPIHSDMKPLE